jgi:hypothetical protein
MSRKTILLPQNFNGKADFNGRPQWSITSDHLIYHIMNYYEFGDRSDFYGRIYCTFFIDRKTLELENAIITPCHSFHGIKEGPKGIFRMETNGPRYQFETKAAENDDIQTGSLLLENKSTTDFVQTMKKIWKEDQNQINVVSRKILKTWEDQGNEKFSLKNNIPLIPFTQNLIEIEITNDDGKILSNQKEEEKIQFTCESFPSLCSCPEQHPNINQVLEMCQSQLPVEKGLAYYHGEWMSLVYDQKKKIVMASHLEGGKKLHLFIAST